MLMDQRELNEALELVAFTPEQQLAVKNAWRKVVQDALLDRMACEDASHLADVNGPDRLGLADKVLTEKMGELADIYPALILLSRVNWLKAEYRRLEIDECMLVDALSDIPLWMSNCQKRTGRIALMEYTWLTNHVRMRLFRLGRLEYIYTQSRVPAWFYQNSQTGEVAVLADDGLRFDHDGRLSDAIDAQTASLVCSEHVAQGHPIDEMGRIQGRKIALPLNEWKLKLAPGIPVLDVHIPEGPPMAADAISASLDAAVPFYRDKLGIADARAFTCGSWLMAPALAKIAPESNLAAFQRRFRVAPYTTRDDQVFERVYGCAFTGWKDMPMQTRLQRGVRDWYLAGGELRQMQGVILLDQRGTAQLD